jgi:hypothetical protein
VVVAAVVAVDVAKKASLAILATKHRAATEIMTATVIVIVIVKTARHRCLRA